MENKKIIIIGAGPSGITASIYLKRAGYIPYLIESSMPGGKLSLTYKIENYPGFDEILGSDLAFKMMDQLTKNNIDINFETVEEVEKNEDKVYVKTNINEYLCDVVIIASGTKENKLNIKGEEEFFHKGISFCAVCDGGFYRNKPMAIIGGGNSALEEALYLENIASPLYVIHRRNELRADKIVQERAFSNEKLEFVWDSVVKEIKGEDLVSTVVLENVKTGVVSDLAVNGVFPYIGILPNVDGFSGQIEQDSKGFILTDETMKTSVDGVYAVGDVRVTPLRQVVTAASDGAIGAVYAVRYIEALKEVTV